jgi:hypothetical protein
MENRELDKKVIEKIMDRAIEIHRQCPDECRDFRIMDSPMRKNTLILRWTTINIENIEKPKQCYHYECYHPDGTSQNCSINYDTAEEANEFFFSLRTLYKQEFAKDHRLKNQLQ